MVNENSLRAVPKLSQAFHHGIMSGSRSAEENDNTEQYLDLLIYLFLFQPIQGYH